MSKKFPLNPAHPERICWGCDRYCPVDDMGCGNGSVATLHPAELFGSDWLTSTTAQGVGNQSASLPGRYSQFVGSTVFHTDKRADDQTSCAAGVPGAVIGTIAIDNSDTSFTGRPSG